MAQLKEKMASMVKMMERMANMMQASTTAATPTLSPTGEEGQITFVGGEVTSLNPVSQASKTNVDLLTREGTQSLTAVAVGPTNDNALMRGETGAGPNNYGEALMYQAPPTVPSDQEWEKEIGKLHMEIKALQGSTQGFASYVDGLCV